MKTEELPPCWALGSGRELFAFVTSGSRGWADFYSDTGPVFVRIGNLDHHTISLDLRETQRVQPPTGVEGTRTRTRPDDILISITADVGMVGLVQPSLGEAYINQHIALARPVHGLNAAYLAWFLTSPRGKSQLRSMERGATKKGLGLDDIRAVKIPIAPLSEQERIVSEIEKQLTRLDSGLAALKCAQAQLKRYRASVLKAACEGRLVPTEAELARREKRDYEPADKLLARILKERRARWEADQLAKMKAAGKPPKDDKWKAKYSEPDAPDVAGLPSLPEGWVWAGPDQLSAPEDWSLGIGPFGSNLKVSDYREAGVPLVFVRNIRSGQFGTEGRHYVTKEKADELRPHEVKPGDVLITKMGEPPGDACLYPASEPAGVITADCIRLRLSSLLSHRDFFVHCINSQVVREQILRLTQGVAQQKISLERFRTLALPVPPLEEQRRILGRIEEQLSVELAVRTLTASSIQRATRLRQAVLRQAFAGALVPQNPSDEPASKLLERISAAVENKPLPKQGRARQATAVPKMKKATR